MIESIQKKYDTVRYINFWFELTAVFILIFIIFFWLFGGMPFMAAATQLFPGWLIGGVVGTSILLDIVVLYYFIKLKKLKK